MAEEGTGDSVFAFRKSINEKHCSCMVAYAWVSLTEDITFKRNAGIYSRKFHPAKGRERICYTIYNHLRIADCDHEDTGNCLNDDAVDPGDQFLTDGQIASSSFYGKNNEPDDNESAGASKNPSYEEAIVALEKVIEWN